MAASNLLQEYKQNTIIVNKPVKLEPKYGKFFTIRYDLWLCHAKKKKLLTRFILFIFRNRFDVRALRLRKL